MERQVMAWNRDTVKDPEIRASLAVAGAYETREKNKFSHARKLITVLTKALVDFEKHYRELWYERNKTFGYEVMQIRLAGQVARWRELDRRLKDLAGGKINSIPELEEKTVKRVGTSSTYQLIATASVYF